MKKVEDPIKEMKEFHKELLRQLDMLEKALEKFRKDGKTDYMRLSLDGFIFFAKKDLRLHIKDEEKALFPVMIKNKYLESDIREIVNDHDYLNVSIDALKLIRNMEKKTRPEIEKKVREITDTLRTHVHKEEEVVFKLAQGRLTDKQLSRVTNMMNKLRRPE